MTLFEFIKQYYDVPNTGDTPQNMGQCVGLVEAWIDALSLPHVWGNAADLLANADSNSYDIIQNTPDGVPSLGDIFVFGPSYGGGVGHTGIVVAADTNLVSLFEQNDGLNNGTPQLKTYTYVGALGWLHPKGVVVDQQSLISALENQRDTNWNLHLADQQTIQTLQSQLTDLQNQLTECQSKQEVTTTTATTEVPLTASTTGGSTIVNASVTTTESANVTIPTEQPTPAVQTASTGEPKKQPMRLSDLIVYLFSRIISTLFK